MVTMVIRLTIVLAFLGRDKDFCTQKFHNIGYSYGYGSFYMIMTQSAGLGFTLNFFNLALQLKPIFFL